MQDYHPNGLEHGKLGQHYGPWMMALPKVNGPLGRPFPPAPLITHFPRLAQLINWTIQEDMCHLTTEPRNI